MKTFVCAVCGESAKTGPHLSTTICAICDIEERIDRIQAQLNELDRVMAGMRALRKQLRK